MRGRLGGLAALAVVAVLALAGAACGVADPPGTLRVLAAASLTEAFDELARTFEARHPDVTVALSSGASSALARQVVDGAPGDVLATADEATMALVVAAGRVVSGPTVFALNRLAVAVARGNPRGITGLADLARPGLTVVLCAPEVPCGRAAAEALEAAAVDLRPASFEEHVKAVVSRVSLGEADAGLAYATDVRAPGVEGVAVDDAHNVTTAYPVAVLRDTAAARAWVDHVQSPEGRQVLARFGFAPR
ncbi:MAG: molybdate ABC transporter substrate-binding protein [Actinomycetota bacterium]|nr:molybdate ABC transporter substrate-binding protein [Actinomycetota bacterium]